MAYITLDEAKTQFPALAIQITKGTVSQARAEQWIRDGDGLIDSYLSARFLLPFSSTPPLVKTLSYELFEYFWQKDIHTPTATGDEVPWLYKRYDKSIAILEGLRDGAIVLVDSTGKAIDPSSALLSTIRSNHQEVDQIFNVKDSWDQSVPDDYASEPTF